jgi:hypothetical protein
MITLFGLTDPGILLGYILAIVLALACIVYGLLNWNTGGDRNDN